MYNKTLGNQNEEHFRKMENWQQSFFIHMFNESVLSKQNIERWYPLAENKVEETHENQAKQISF